MSDDDIMCEGALQKVKECIKEQSPDLILLNSYSFERSIVNLKSKKLNIPVSCNVLTKDKSFILNKVGNWITYFSGNIIKKEHFLSINKPNKFVGTYFSQTHIALLTTKGDRSIAIIKDACVARRQGMASGYNLYQVWVKEYKRLLLSTGYEAGYEWKELKGLFVRSMNSGVRKSIVIAPLIISCANFDY